MSDFDFDIETMQEEGNPMLAYVDIVFVIDITAGMNLIIDKIKSFATRIYDTLSTATKEENCSLEQLRVKIIGYRDFYHINKRTGTYETAIEESDFFYLPEDNSKFRDFVDTLEASGGGDIPESGLEALALAMKTDWVQPANREDKKRHIIILFTDAPAHPLEKAATDEKNPAYPDGMPKDYDELLAWWGSAEECAGQDEDAIMDTKAKRLHIFYPEGADPWDAIVKDFNLTCCTHIVDGGEELSDEVFIATLLSPIC